MTPELYRLSLDQPADYLIQVAGWLREDWSEYFGGMAITTEAVDDGLTVTTLTGSVLDQASLHGMLNHIRDLGLPLLKVEWINH